MFFSCYRSLKVASKNQTSRVLANQARANIRPLVEQLEDRVTPALTVTDSITPSELVSTILGKGVTVSNIQYQGNNQSSGTFSGGTGIIGFEKGIILSTGKATEVVGDHTFFASTSNGLPGDAQL